MAIVLGNKGVKRNRVLDFFLLLTSALCGAVIITAAFWMSDQYHFSAMWVFGIGAALIFFLVVGWGYRSKFRSFAFAAFFFAWLFIHVGTFVVAIEYLGFSYYLPIAVVELWLGYMVAIWQFGPPPDQGVE